MYKVVWITKFRKGEDRDEMRRRWLEVNTVGTVSNRDGCGARIRLTLADGSKMASEMFCSADQKTVHFGLGSATRLAKLDVTWPSGIRQELRNLRVDRVITVQEPTR